MAGAGAGTGGFQTPPFRPDRHESTFLSPLSTKEEIWTEVLVAPCHFPLSVFLSTMKSLCLHPERNSSFILRADPLPPLTKTGMSSRQTDDDHKDDVDERIGQRLGDLELVEEIRVRLMPRQPRRDGTLDKRCLFFRSKLTSSSPLTNRIDGHAEVTGDAEVRAESSAQGSQRASTILSDERDNEEAKDFASTVPENSDGTEEGLMIMVTEAKTAAEVPYYHPPVRKIAFRYIPFTEPEVETTPVQPIDKLNGNGSANALDAEAGTEDEQPRIRGKISIAYLIYPEGIPDLPFSAIPANGKLSSSPLAKGLGASTARTKRRSPLAGPASTLSDQVAGTEREAAVVSSSTAADEEHTAQSTSGSAQLLAQAQAKAQAQARVQKQTADKAKMQSQAIDASSGGKQAEERLFRTCLSLLERLYKHGYGNLVGYQKRRTHDVIVPRDNFQDLYLVLKDRHRHLDSRAPRAGYDSTGLGDVKRHVWKGSPMSTLSPPSQRKYSLNPTSDPSARHALPDDPGLPDCVDLSEWGEQDIAIAAFLMLLWKEMYPAREVRLSESDFKDEPREWDTWGRPEGGFVDLGCGNGLLVHILVSEGYAGKGYELRARRTWPQYPPKTQDALVELPINPLGWFPETIEEWESGHWAGKDECVVRKGVFLIGNHSDELTPWLPFLSLLPSKPIPHLSLPCCLHTLDSSFNTLQYTTPEPAHPFGPEGGFENGLEPGVSRYKSYLVWLGWCGLMCGWLWEKEGLRVPSTKGWGIIARKRWTTSAQDRDCRIWALEQVNAVRQRGSFKVREKEGKEH